HGGADVRGQRHLVQQLPVVRDLWRDGRLLHAARARPLAPARGDGAARAREVGALMHWSVVPASLPYLLQGFRATLLLSVTVLLAGTIVGAAWGLLRVVPVAGLQRLMTAVIEGVRSVPLLLQMFFIFFAVPALGVQMPVFLSAALAMTLWM